MFWSSSYEQTAQSWCIHRYGGGGVLVTTSFVGPSTLLSLSGSRDFGPQFGERSDQVRTKAMLSPTCSRYAPHIFHNLQVK